MSKFQPSFDPETQALVYTLSSSLLVKYFPNLEGIITLRKSELPTGLSVKILNSDTIKLSIPIPISQDEKGFSVVSVKLSNEINGMSQLITDFVSMAIHKEQKNTEYIPLSGYPKEKLMEEIKDAVKFKRNLRIIRTYKEYKKLIAGKLSFDFEQVTIEYGTNLYYSIVLLISKGNLSSLKKLVRDKFVKLNW